MLCPECLYEWNEEIEMTQFAEGYKCAVHYVFLKDLTQEQFAEWERR